MKCHLSGGFFSWVLPTPGLWNKIGLSGNTIDANGIRLGTEAPFHGFLPQAFERMCSMWMTHRWISDCGNTALIAS